MGATPGPDTTARAERSCCPLAGRRDGEQRGGECGRWVVGSHDDPPRCWCVVHARSAGLMRSCWLTRRCVCARACRGKRRTLKAAPGAGAASVDAGAGAGSSGGGGGGMLGGQQQHEQQQQQQQQQYQAFLQQQQLQQQRQQQQQQQQQCGEADGGKGRKHLSVALPRGSPIATARRSQSADSEARAISKAEVGGSDVGGAGGRGRGRRGEGGGGEAAEGAERGRERDQQQAGACVPCRVQCPGLTWRVHDVCCA
eukprot:2755293-Rhodomonas_salina.1